MADRYYLLSKDTGGGPSLIGELRRLRRGDYQFRYMLRGDRFPEWYLQIPGLRDIHQLYGSREARRFILHRVVPEEESWAADVLMQQHAIKGYDEWDMLEALIVQHAQYENESDPLPLCDSNQIFYFYREIPEDANRYD